MATMNAPRRVFVIGVGMTKFEKPGRREDFDYPEMAKECVTKALEDAGLNYKEIQQAAVGYCYGESTCGQRALYQFGLTGIPIYNVNNNCATGSTALFLAKNLIQGGNADCVLALGFEKMEKGSLGLKWTDRTIPTDKLLDVINETYGISSAPMTTQIFGNAGREHMEKYGTKPEHFAKIAEKNHRHSVNNPLSQFRDEYNLEQVMSSRMVHEPLTKLQCCPTSDGGAAAIVCSEEYVIKHGLQDKAVEILAMEMATDMPGVFEKSCIKACGQDMTTKAARAALSKANLSIEDVQVVELHDCFASNELITYEGLGLCPIGKAGDFIDRGDNTYGGKYVVNPSGGLISKGHPLGATGLAQCYELCNQLRNECGTRQVKGAKVGLQHNLGLGGACVVGLYKKYKPLQTSLPSSPAADCVETSFKSDAIFIEIERKLEEEKESFLKKFKAIFAFELSGSDGKKGFWYVDAKKKGIVVRGKSDEIKADCTLKMKDEDCFKMMVGQLNAQTAFMQGKVKISGNMALAMKLQQLKVTNLKSKM